MALLKSQHYIIEVTQPSHSEYKHKHEHDTDHILTWSLNSEDKNQQKQINKVHNFMKSIYKKIRSIGQNWAAHLGNKDEITFSLADAATTIIANETETSDAG